MSERILIPRDWELIKVRLGEYNTDTNPDCGEGVRVDYICADPVIDIDIEKRIVHEEYNNYHHNDIALLQLTRDVTFSAFVRPICLPYNQAFQTDNLNFVVTGFGRTELKETSNIKLKTNVGGVSQGDCQKMYDRRVIISNQLCASGVDGKDSW